MNMKVDGKRIRTLRLERSWSQGWLGEKAGVSLRTVQRMENEGVASLQSRRAVAEALDLPASALGRQPSRQKQTAPASIGEPSPDTSANRVAYRVRLDADNPDGVLHAGMTAQVRFVTSHAENVLTLPVEALTLTDSPNGTGNATVEVVLPDGTTENRDIVVGARDSANAEVISGLEEGERVRAGTLPAANDA